MPSCSASERGLRGEPEQLRSMASIVVGVEGDNGDWREALEEFAGVDVNEWLGAGVVKDPPPDAYAMLLASLAKSNRLVVDGSEGRSWPTR